MNARSAIGRYGEDVAARSLEQSGLQVLERNWRCRDGEIDIVARDGDVLVVCEVKTRTGTGYQHPMAGIDDSKAERLRHLAERWARERWPAYPPARPGTGGRPPGAIRIDVVAVVRSRRGAASVEHVRGVF